MKFELFPTTKRKFVLHDSQEDTIDRLRRRTEESYILASKRTDKSFIGDIHNNRFRIISSVIGTGAFCVLTGEINNNEGFVQVKVHIAFKLLIGIPVLVLIILSLISPLLGWEESQMPNIGLLLLLVFFTRYFYVGVSFKVLSKQSLNRLRDVLDVEWLYD
ncbi:hypothetical protein KFE94_11110 [bacterium SCSIO 12643]|nr:hypothetical protein KFE94_11110 [bacterium SCSIO 12643]